jgi:ribosomal protein S18 acetylase RimI-like enzyme
MIVVRQAAHAWELEGILALQRANLRRNLSDADAAQQGFLTAEYTLPFLHAMNAARPSIIAIDQSQVVGYALVATPSIRDGHPFIRSLFEAIDGIPWGKGCLGDCPYVVVGQLCVGREHRGQGLVQRLYRHFRETLQADYHCAVTDIARENTRSLRAHQATGFQVIHSFTYEGRDRDVVLWDWRTAPHRVP